MTRRGFLGTLVALASTAVVAKEVTKKETPKVVKSILKAHDRVTATEVRDTYDLAERIGEASAKRIDKEVLHAFKQQYKLPLKTRKIPTGNSYTFKIQG